MKNKYFIGSKRKKNFSFGYTRFFGDFGLVDLVFVILFIFLFIIFFLIFSPIIAVLINAFLLVILIFLIKQWDGIKAYDYVIDAFKYYTNIKVINNKSIKINQVDKLFIIKGGFELNYLSNEEIDILIESFNRFINVYDGSFKILKVNDYFNLEKNEQYLYHWYKKNKNFKKDLLLNALEKVNYLNESKTNPQLYILFSNPKQDQLDLIKRFFPLEIELVDNLHKRNIEKHFIENNYNVNSSSIENNDYSKIIATGNFKNSINFAWLSTLFSDINSSFVLTIENIDLKQKQVLLNQLSRNNSNPKFKSNFDRYQNIKDEGTNRSVVQDVVFNNEELRLIDLKVVYQSYKYLNEDIFSKFKKLNKLNFYENNFKLSKSYFKQRNSFEDLFEWNIGNYPILNSSLASSYPFLNQSFVDKWGWPLGIISNNYPFIYDSRSLENKTNFHTLILGSSGSGKTVLLKKIIASEIATNRGKQFIFDPHNEFGIFAKNFNGSIIDISKISLNPLKISMVNYKNFKIKIDEKILKVNTFYNFIFKQQLNFEFNNLLQEFLLQLEKFYYKNLNYIVRDEEYTFDDLKDFDVKFNPLIFPFTKGIYKHFNQKQGINLFNSSLIIFQSKELFSYDETFQQIIIFLLFNEISEVIYQNQKAQIPINITIDEAGKFLRNDSFLKMLSPLFSESRKFNTKITIATQNLTDLYNDINSNVNLSNIFANISNMFIGYIKNDQRSLLNKFLNYGRNTELSKLENEHINKKQGSFVYFLDDKRYIIQITLDQDYKRLLFDPHIWKKDQQ